MAEVYNPTVAQFRIEGQYLSQNYNNVIYADSPREWTAELLTAVSAAIGSWLSVDLLPNFVNQLVLTGITATSMAGINAPQIFNPFVTPIVGGVNEAGLPGSVAIVATKKSQNRGRSGRGRTYFAGLSEGVVTGNTVAQGWIDAVNANLAELEEQLLAADARHVIYSRFSVGLPRPVGIAFPVLTYAIENNVVDSQRGRLPGRGN